MSTIGAGLPPQQITPSYSPLGKPAVGLESPDTKDQTLPPVEQSASADKTRNRFSGKKTEAVSADAERSKNRQGGTTSQDLTDEEIKSVRELVATDREVRAHEAAHVAVGGNLAGAPSFRFITGPDGQQYAVGGEVPIALEPVPDNPQATLRNAEQVHAATLAPAKPSAQDLQVAAAASQLAAAAQLQIAAQHAVSTATTTPNGRHSASAFKQAAGGDNAPPGGLLDQLA